MEFRILGPFEVYADGRAVALGGTRPRALLAVLVLHPNEPVSAERLALALWGVDAPAGAVKTIQVHVSRLRKALRDPGAVVTTAAGYRLRLRHGELDAERFEQLCSDGLDALAAGRAEQAAAMLREALALWRGPPLADLAGMSFAEAEITQLEEQRLAALEARVDADLAAGRHAELVGELQRLTSQYPLRERLHGQLMLALYRSGRQADALAAFRNARVILVDQLGIEPGAALREINQGVLTQDPSIDAPPAPAGAAPAPQATFPAVATALFGREDDLHALTRMALEQRTRHMTLIGPGGVGKTRLAIEAGRRLAGDFADGAGFVALAEITEPRELASAIARAIDVPVRPGEPPTAALQRFLAERHMLLVLDNFEHLVDSASMVGDLLAACPRVTVVVTSREPTRLAAERLYPVQPLQFPDGDVTPAESESYGAVAMFCDRIRARNPGFALEESSTAHVLKICRRLDGLPLALELAAARAGLLALGELAARLDHLLAVLGDGPRDAPERQRTLRATIDWSFQLLTGSERRAFARMSVFAGGATVAAAEAVTGASLNALDSLVNKQLLVRRGDRVQMLQTVREYAIERFGEDAGRREVEKRLEAWWLRLAREANPHLVRADRGPWLVRLDAELANAIAALTRALDHGDVEVALELAAELGHYWWRTHGSEHGVSWLEEAVERGGDGSIPARARAHLYRARLRTARRFAAHREDLHASLDLFRACDGAAGIAACLSHLAVAEAMFGDSSLAPDLRDEALRYARQSRDEETLGLALADIALSASSYEEAAGQAPAAVQYLSRTGNLLDLVIVCSVTGYYAIADRRYREALEWLDQALDAASQLANRRSVFFISGNRGLARLFLDELDEAEHAFRVSIAAACDVAAEDLVDEALLGMAAVAARRGDTDRAACLTGAARAHGGPGRNRAEETVVSRMKEEILHPARHRSGRDKWDRAEQKGASLTVQQAIELALAPAGEFRPGQVSLG